MINSINLFAGVSKPQSGMFNKLAEDCQEIHGDDLESTVRTWKEVILYTWC